MLSRVAESLYWLARYIERAENSARLINVNAHLLLDLPIDMARDWTPLVVITGSTELFTERYDSYDERNVVRFLTTDAANPGSILSSLSLAREGARTIRETIPRELWELINELYLFAKENANAGVSKRRRFDYLEHIIRGAQTVVGMTHGIMNHDAGFEFLRIGRILERADMTTRIIDVRSASLLPGKASTLGPFENIQWMSVLKSLTGYQVYRQSIQAGVRRDLVLAFLLLDTEFPRSFSRCVNVVVESIEPLPNGKAVLRELRKLRRKVKQSNIAELGNSQDALNVFLDELQIGLATVHKRIAATWFLPNSTEHQQLVKIPSA